MIKVSVIIPVYNRQGCIKDTIEGLKQQTLQDMEIICIDDGSTDNTLPILNELKKEDNRIKVYHQENQGAGTARNYGISVASGEYLFFLDSDDRLCDKDALISLLITAEQKGASLCGGRLIIENARGSFVTPETDLPEGWVDYIDYQENFYFTRFLYRKDTIINNDLYFPKISMYEDPVFLLKTMIHVKSFYQIDKDIYYYYHNNNNNNNNNKPTYRQTMDYLDGIIESLQICIDKGFWKLYKSIYMKTIRRISAQVEPNLVNLDNQGFCKLMLLNSLIRKDLLKKEDVEIEDNYLIPPLCLLMNTSKCYIRIRNLLIVRIVYGIVKLFRHS